MKRWIALVATVVAVITANSARADAPAAPPGWGSAMRAQTLTAAEKALDGYFFAEKNPQIRAAIEAHRAQLLAIGDPQKFADAVTNVLYGAAHDKHLGLWYSVVPQLANTKPTPADIAKMRQFDAYTDYGYESSARLPGNIGYVRIMGFARFPGPQKTFDRMMGLVDGTDALIIDLRNNSGGDPRAVNYLLAYFFPKPVEVTGFLWRKGAKVTPERMYTPAKIGGSRYLNKPVYVLTSNDTISGGEQFCYDMQTLRRATLVGATTAGGANIGGVVGLNPHFGIFIPTGAARNPYTKTNWEGVGVKPQIVADPKEALLDAYTRALKAAANPLSESAGARTRALKDPHKALQIVFPMEP